MKEKVLCVNKDADKPYYIGELVGNEVFQLSPKFVRKSSAIRWARQHQINLSNLKYGLVSEETK